MFVPCIRCFGFRYQTRTLDLANKMDNMFKAVSIDADPNPKGARKSALKKRTRSERDLAGGSFSSV